MATPAQVWKSVGYLVLLLLIISITVSISVIQYDNMYTVVGVAGFGMILTAILYRHAIKQSM